MGILWRFIVLFLVCWFTLGFFGYTPRSLSQEMYTELNGGALAISLVLAWLWQIWSRSRKNGPQT